MYIFDYLVKFEYDNCVIFKINVRVTTYFLNKNYILTYKAAKLLFESLEIKKIFSIPIALH